MKGAVEAMSIDRVNNEERTKRGCVTLVTNETSIFGVVKDFDEVFIELLPGGDRAYYHTVGGPAWPCTVAC
jgi:hypothetical protein